jgi:hypothetical protein
VGTVLGRGAYTAVEEQEAELIATLILGVGTAAQRRIEASWRQRPTWHWS